MYVFACFYAVLQPAVVGFTAVGLVIYYWTQKIVLFRLSKRPVPGTDYINNIMFAIIKLGPLIYTFGSFLCGSDIIVSSPIMTKIPNFAALGASILFIYISSLSCFKDEEIIRTALYED